MLPSPPPSLTPLLPPSLPTCSAIQGQFSYRNACPIRAEITQAQDAAPIRDDDHVDVTLGPVVHLEGREVVEETNK